jgi:hypothetical protein
MRSDIFTAQLASRIFEDAGMGAIWRLQVAAAEARRDGLSACRSSDLKDSRSSGRKSVAAPGKFPPETLSLNAKGPILDATNEDRV